VVVMSDMRYMNNMEGTGPIRISLSNSACIGRSKKCGLLVHSLRALHGMLNISIIDRDLVVGEGRVTS
jgi:hypothetical protein